MSSPAQAAANAANARYSSGPRTQEGKARASRNAVKHGFTANQSVIPPDQQAQYDRFRAALQTELAPTGPLETVTFDQLVREAWKQQSIQAMEDELLSLGLAAVQDEATAKTLDRLNRYATAAGRAYYRALKELRVLQTERTLRQTIEPEIAELIPTLASLPAVSKQQHVNTRTSNAMTDREIDDIVNAPMPGPFPWRDEIADEIAPEAVSDVA